MACRPNPYHSHRGLKQDLEQYLEKAGVFAEIKQRRDGVVDVKSPYQSMKPETVRGILKIAKRHRFLADSPKRVKEEIRAGLHPLDRATGRHEDEGWLESHSRRVVVLRPPTERTRGVPSPSIFSVGSTHELEELAGRHVGPFDPGEYGDEPEYGDEDVYDNPSFKHTARYAVRKGKRTVSYHRSYSLALAARRRAGKGATVVDRKSLARENPTSGIDRMPGETREAAAKRMSIHAWDKGWQSAHERAIRAWREVEKHSSSPAKRRAALAIMRTHAKHSGGMIIRA